MFFAGILIGLGIYFLLMFIFEKFDMIGAPLIGTIIVFVGLFSSYPQMAWGALITIVVLFIIGYNLGKKREEQAKRDLENFERNLKNQQPIDYYKSHCWNCGHKIDGSWNKKCPDCNAAYICPKCGACKCDFGKKPPFKH